MCVMFIYIYTLTVALVSKSRDVEDVGDAKGRKTCVCVFVSEN